MKNIKSSFALNDQELNFDFDEWVDLYQQDPETFEQRRISWSEQLIQSADRSNQRRLSGLLFQINMQKLRSKTAMQSCINISRLMWDKFYELDNELQQFIQ